MRRRVLIAGLAAVLVAGSGAAWKFRLFGKHYPPTPYDDLLDQIQDRRPALVLGGVARKSLPGAAVLAAQLRRDGRTLSARAAAEPGQAQLREVAGWILPESVALYAALAAQAQPPGAMIAP
jgi:hypothetical protein